MSKSLKLDTTKSMSSKESFDYLVTSSSQDGYDDCISFGDTTSSCITNQRDVKGELDLMRHERDLACQALLDSACCVTV
jgi:hypothetical protein